MKNAVLAVCLCLPALAAAEIYKWVDSNGQVHYGDTPAGQSHEETPIHSLNEGPAAQGADDERRENIRKWVDARQQEREQKKREQAESDKQRKARDKQCAALRRELRDMEIGGTTWYRLDDDGNRQFYSDKDIAVAIEKRRAVIAQHCE